MSHKHPATPPRNPRRNTGPRPSYQHPALQSEQSSYSLYAPSSQFTQDPHTSDPIGSSPRGNAHHRFQRGGLDVQVESFEDLLHPKDLKRLEVGGDPSIAQRILDGYPTARTKGWCAEIDLKPSKEGGYIQVSAGGANKFAVLQEVVLWADGKFKVNPSDHVSHLCGNPKCKTVGHMVVEEAEKNNARKGCLVHIGCPHCEKRIFVCAHEPPCIKYAGEKFKNMSEFLEGGICARLSDLKNEIE